MLFLKVTVFSKEMVHNNLYPVKKKKNCHFYTFLDILSEQQVM